MNIESWLWYLQIISKIKCRLLVIVKENWINICTNDLKNGKFVYFSVSLETHNISRSKYQDQSLKLSYSREAIAILPISFERGQIIFFKYFRQKAPKKVSHAFICTAQNFLWSYNYYPFNRGKLARVNTNETGLRVFSFPNMSKINKTIYHNLIALIWRNTLTPKRSERL